MLKKFSILIFEKKGLTGELVSHLNNVEASDVTAPIVDQTVLQMMQTFPAWTEIQVAEVIKTGHKGGVVWT